MRKAVWTALLALPLMVHAVDSTENLLFGNNVLSVLIYSPAYDISLKYLKLLFGGEIGLEVAGGGNGYIGNIFAYFNSGLLVIIFGYAGFTTFEATMLASTEGTMLRRKIKPLVMLRVASGIMLVAPMQSGYCLAQKFLIQIVLLGVGIANGAWMQAVKYADAFNGSAYISSPASKYADVGHIAQQIMLKVYASNYCMQKDYDDEKLVNPNLSRSGWSMRTGTECGGDQYTVCFGDSRNKTKCGSYRSSSSDISVKAAVQQSILQAGRVLQGVVINQRILEEAKRAGSITSDGCDGTTVATACVPAVLIVDVANNFYTNILAFRVLPAAGIQSIVSQNPYGQGSALQKGWAMAGSYFNNLATGKASGVFQAGGSSQSIDMKPLPGFMAEVDSAESIKYDSQNIASRVSSIILGNQTSDKPINFQAPGYEDTAIAASIVKMMKMVITPDTFVDDIESKYNVVGFFLSYINLSVGFKNIYALLTNSVQAFTGIQILNTNSWDNLVTNMGSWNSNKYNSTCFSTLQQPSCAGNSALCMHNIFSDSTNKCLQVNGVGLVSQMKRRWEIDNLDSTQNKSLVPINPFFAMVMIGNSLVNYAANYWNTATSETTKQLVTLSWVLYGAKVATLAIALGVAPVLCMNLQWCYEVSMIAAITASVIFQALGNLFSTANYIIDLPSGIGNAVAMIVYSLGNFLGFFLPFLPMIVFTMAVIGWLILVIEAMVATPLVALGLTSPKGHDFLGQAQQSIMMYVSTCMRPVLIIISFFIVINIIFVSFEFLNYVYLMALSNLINFKVALPSFNLIVIFASMVVYAYFCFMLLTTVLETINEIPDKVSRWIGGTMLSPGGNIHQIVSETKGGFAGSAQSAGSGAQQMAAGAVSHAARVAQSGADRMDMATRPMIEMVKSFDSRFKDKTPKIDADDENDEKAKAQENPPGPAAAAAPQVNENGAEGPQEGADAAVNENKAVEPAQGGAAAGGPGPDDPAAGGAAQGGAAAGEAERDPAEGQ